MKNILISTNTRDNLGTSLSFVKDIDDITDPILKRMVINCISNIPWAFEDYWVGQSHMCGSDQGYIFNDFRLLTKDLPITIDHIVEYVF